MLVLLSGVLNFPVLDDDKVSYVTGGGYISWPLFYVLEQVFWAENAMAIKVIVVFFCIGLLVRILYRFRVPLSVPRVKIKLPQQKKREIRATSSVRQKSVSLNNSPATPSSSVQQGNILKHMFESRGGSSKEKNILKKALKSSLAKSVDDKIHQKTMTQISFPKDKPSFSLDLLRTQSWEVHVDHTLLAQKAEMVQSKLAEFGVPVVVDGFDVGPSIIQIRVKPEAGIKVSRIESLKDDLALASKSKTLRIVAPIPWTDVIGIQIPNPDPRIVHLGDVLWSRDFKKSMQSGLMNMTLGQAIDGQNIIKSLAGMPHLLIAWATWSGKSVGVNDFILSLMYQNNPNELKFLMIDPKQVELEMYAWLPYLLAPIVTQADKALKLLQRAVDEMESRYTKLSKARVKKLSEYNTKHPDQKLYRIVVVIDELADLMMSSNKKEVEISITRIAQKARAVWIHLIVATQRPSVNVITWLIKANMPTRIAFGVVSQIDSRTILWQKWAEDLLGKWDLLYMDPTIKYPKRIQAPFVDTDEIDRVISSLKERYMSWLQEDDIYHPEILRILEEKPEMASDQYGSGWRDDDELVEQAMQVVLESRRASATFLQRKLNVWFARAARIMDQLEERGVVGPQEWAKPREILM